MNEINWRSLESGVDLLRNSAIFSRSEINQKLLIYLLAEMRAGRGAAINEYTIAQDVFSRGDDFDPAKDPIVRVRMRRLRNAITQANAQLETSMPHVDLPIGQYQLHCSDPEQPPAPTMARPRRFDLVGAALALAFMGLVALSLLQTRFAPLPSPLTADRPVIFVERFRNLTGNTQNDAQEFNLKQQIAINLDRFDLVDVVLHQGVRAPTFILQGHILDLETEAVMIVRLIDVDSSTRIYERRLNQPIGTRALDEVLTDMITVASRDVAGSGGALLRSPYALRKESDLHCLALADRFLNALTPEAFEAAHTCLVARPQHVLNDARHAAAFGMIQVYSVEAYALWDSRAVPPGIQSTAEHVARYAKDIALRHPTNAQVQTFLGHVLQINGEHAGAKAAYRRALQINPAKIILDQTPPEEPSTLLMTDAVATDLDWDLCCSQAALQSGP